MTPSTSQLIEQALDAMLDPSGEVVIGYEAHRKNSIERWFFHTAKTEQEAREQFLRDNSDRSSPRQVELYVAYRQGDILFKPILQKKQEPPDGIAIAMRQAAAMRRDAQRKNYTSHERRDFN